MTSTVSITNDTLYPREGPQEATEGDQLVYTCIKEGVTTIASPTMYVYKGSTDKTSTYTTGSMSASGNVVTTKTITNLVGGDTLHVTLQGTCDGIYMTFGKFWLTVRKKSGR